MHHMLILELYSLFRVSKSLILVIIFKDIINGIRYKETIIKDIRTKYLILP